MRVGDIITYKHGTSSEYQIVAKCKNKKDHCKLLLMYLDSKCDDIEHIKSFLKMQERDFHIDYSIARFDRHYCGCYDEGDYIVIKPYNENKINGVRYV